MLFSHPRTMIHCTAYSNTNNIWRTRISAYMANGFKNESFTPSISSPCNNVLNVPMFSLPPPLGMTVIVTRSPSTISVCNTAGVLSLVLIRSRDLQPLIFLNNPFHSLAVHPDWPAAEEKILPNILPDLFPWWQCRCQYHGNMRVALFGILTVIN